jgi:hypothetical protein
MSKGDFDFDQLVQGLADDENKRKNSIVHDGWGLEDSSEEKKRPAPKRRKVTWIVPTLGAGLVMGGAAILIVGGYMRPKAVAQEERLVSASDTFATVAPAAPRGPNDPVVESSRTLPAQPEAQPAGDQLPAATLARRAVERQRPVPGAPTKAKDEGEADPSDLLALAGQEKAESKVEVKEAAPAPKAAAPAEKTEAPAEEKLPDSLSRGLIHKGFQSVKAKVLACKDKLPEGTTVIEVSAMIRPDGTVEDASADGAVGDSPAGACVAAAVKSAEFARFSGTEPQKVSYPYPVK